MIVAALGAGGDVGVGPRPNGVAGGGVDAGGGAGIGAPLAVEPALDLLGGQGHAGVSVVGEESDERGEGAGPVVAWAVEVEYPLDDAAHRLALGVGRGPQHGGDQLFGLAPPEAVVRAFLSPAAGQHLRGGERSSKVGRCPQWAPGGGRDAADPERVEHLDLAGGAARSQGCP